MLRSDYDKDSAVTEKMSLTPEAIPQEHIPRRDVTYSLPSMETLA